MNSAQLINASKSADELKQWTIWVLCLSGRLPKYNDDDNRPAFFDSGISSIRFLLVIVWRTVPNFKMVMQKLASGIACSDGLSSLFDSYGPVGRCIEKTFWRPWVGWICTLKPCRSLNVLLR